MGNKKSIGLPSGPNEFLKDITQHISVEGYKRYSEDVNNPYNIIESGNITMEDVDFPVKGTDNLGNEQIMMPGNNYQFPGDSVLEVPMAQTGFEVPKRQGVRDNGDGSESTHLMATETLDGKNWFSFPTLFQDPDGTWIDMSTKPWKEAYKEAERRGELIDFGTDKESAIKFGEGSWKPKAQYGREQATISSYEEPAWYEKALDRLASPMTAFGYSARNQDVPDNLPINMEERNAFDSIIDTVNPFAWIKYGMQANNDLDEGNYLDAGLSALGAIPIVPAWLSKSKKVLPQAAVNKIATYTDDVVKGSDDIVEQYVKKFDERTSPIRGGKVFDDGIGEYNSLQSMYNINPKRVVQPIGPVTDQAGKAMGYNMENLRKFQDLSDWRKTNEVTQSMKDEMVSTMKDFNSKGIYHGDLKSNNIMVDAAGNWKIIDPVGYKHADNMTPEMLGEAKKLDLQSIMDIQGYQHGGALPQAQLGALGKFLKPVIKKGIKYADEFIDEAISNVYKYNPTAYNNINSKLPEFLQLNKNNEKWLRQVGKPAIVDAQTTRTVREIGEKIDPKAFALKLEELKNVQLGQFQLNKRYNGPFFKKGETFFKYDKTARPGLDGLRNTRGRSGSSDFLMEFNPSDPTKYKGMDSYFQPAYMQVMQMDPKPFNKFVGDIGIMKPKMRDVDNFDFYKKDWLKGYKKTPLDELQPGGETGEYKVQKGDTFYGIANKNNVSWDTLKEANPNVNIESLGLNQSIVIPKAIDRSPAMPENQVDNSNVLDYKSISNYLVDSRGGTMDTWGQLADTIAFHESSPWSRMDPKAKQYKGGPGRGLFQFEGESFNTALKRYKNVAAAKGYTLKDSIVNAKSADELSSEDQYALFYANLIESKTKLSDFVDGNISSLDVWLSGHKNVEADGDRNSFLESKAAAQKEGIKNGYKTFQEGGEKYKVSSGDNLGKIANKYKTSVDELVRLNNIADPNKISINQELIVPEIPEESTLNKYTIKSGDTLGKLATKYNTSVNQLAALNNIKDVNKISIDQELILPDSYREEKPLKEESWYNVDDIQKNNNKVNDLTDENIIINSQLLNNPNQSYVVIDKKTQRLKLYRGDEVDLDFEVLTGANDGDAQTVTNVIDYNKDGITTEADKRGGKYKTDWMAGNRSTGAGVYTINQSAPTSENRYQNAPSFNLLNESGIQVGTSIHGTPGFRNKFFDDGNLENNSASNGCINGKCSDLQALYNMNLPTGTPVFILPEDEGNSFQQVDGKAVMRMSSKNRKDYLEYTDLRGDEQEGQGGNYSTSTLSYKPIRAKLDKELFEEKVYSAFDFNDDEEFNNTTQPFISALEKNKKDIMLAAQIPGDVYNQIAKMAFGIYGTESNFGDTHSAAGNLGRAATKYLDREGSSSPDIVSKYDTYNVQGDNNSVGYTQIRWSQLNDKEKSALKSFDITSNKDFLNPEKSAIATATILGIRYNEQLTADQKKDVWKNLPSKWNNRSNYSSRVKSNSRYLQFEQLDRLKKGGEIENNIMYKNYIDGVYTGSKMESKAEKIYDKLNRLHYRDAKAKQMTPANYVLTHVIG